MRFQLNSYFEATECAMSLIISLCPFLHKDGSALYRAFLLREFSNENLDFWMAVEDYKNSKPQKMAEKAQQIFNDFVAVKASKQVRP